MGTAQNSYNTVVTLVTLSTYTPYTSSSLSHIYGVCEGGVVHYQQLTLLQRNTVGVWGVGADGDAVYI